MELHTATKQKDILNTQNNTEEIHKENSTLHEREKIEGTPFTLIKWDNQWFMVMGDHRVTEPTATKKEQLKKLVTEKWLLIMHICIIAIKKLQQEKPITGSYKIPAENINPAGPDINFNT